MERRWVTECDTFAAGLWGVDFCGVSWRVWVGWFEGVFYGGCCCAWCKDCADDDVVWGVRVLVNEWMSWGLAFALLCVCDG